MISIRKVVGILSCSFLLCLGLSNVALSEHAPSPSDVMKTDSVSDRQGFQSDDDKQKNVDSKKDSPAGVQDDQRRVDSRGKCLLFRQNARRQGSPFTYG